MSKLEDETATEMWDAYVSADLAGDLSRTHGIDLDDIGVDVDALRDAFYETGESEYHGEGPDSIVWDRWEDIVSAIASRLASGWRPTLATV